MRKILVLFFIFLFTISQVYAYAIKVYDEYGNRVGTYKKEGDSYQLYDFNDKKVENPENIIKNAPSQKTLTEYSRTFYDENMIPIGSWRSGFYGNNGRYYPRYGEFYPTGFYRTPTPYIIRQNAKSDNFFKYADYKNNINYVDTRYPKMHQFK